MQYVTKKIHEFSGSINKKGVFCLISILSVITLMITVFPSSQAVAVFENPKASVNEGTVYVNFDLSNAPEEGMDATLFIIKKADIKDTDPLENIDEIIDAVHLNSQKVMNGENSFDIPINESFRDTALRVYIKADDGSSPIFVDIDNKNTENDNNDAHDDTTLHNPNVNEDSNNPAILTNSVDEIPFDELASLISNNIDGYKLSGKIKTFNPKRSAKIQLMKDDIEIDYIITENSTASGQTEQMFEFLNVESGTYSLVITKQAHTKFTVHGIVIGEEDVDLTQNERPDIRLMTMRCGDINEDGMINDGDLTLLWRKANYNKIVDVVNDPLCDLNGDGMINDGDLTILWLVTNYNKGPVAIDLAGSTNIKQTVNFIDWDGSFYSTQQVAFGYDAILPGNPTRTGYIFTGWNGDYKTVTEDRTIFAQYIPDNLSNIFTIASTTGTIGNEVTVTLQLKGQVNVVSFNLMLYYDMDALQFVRSSGGLRPVVNGETVPGLVQIGYAGADNEKDPTDIVNLVFKIKDTTSVTDTTLSIFCSSAFYINSQGLKADASFETANGVVFIR